mgnify:CR=1 FL=1
MEVHASLNDPRNLLFSRAARQLKRFRSLHPLSQRTDLDQCSATDHTVLKRLDLLLADRALSQGNLLLLGDDDLLSITSVKTYDVVNGTATTLVDETAFLKEPYGGPPYRRLRIHEESSAAWGTATRGGAHVAGSWGHQDVRIATTTTVASGLASDATVTTFVTSASPTISIGQTLFIGTEQLYVSGLSGTTTTVTRGANGTTAAGHANASAISIYTYHPRVVDGTRQIAQRAWKMRDAGASGGYGGGEIPGTSPMDTEWSILNATVGRLCYRSAS